MSVLGDVLVVVGALLVLLASVGLHRFADVYARIHAASKATSAGFVLIAAGAAVHVDGAAARVELAVAAGLLLATTPVGVHLLARAAHRSGAPDPVGLTVDERPDRVDPST